MNLLYTFQAKAKTEKANSTNRHGLPSGSKSHFEPISKNFSSKRLLPPIPSSLASSKSEKVLLGSQIDRLNLKSDSQASRVRMIENNRDFNYISKALSGNQSKRNRFYTDRGEPEPKTPTFQPEDEKIEDLRNLNKKIEQEYKNPFKNSEPGSFSNLASQVASVNSASIARFESSNRLERIPELNPKNSLVSSILSDFPFFTSPNKDLKAVHQSEFLTERRENFSIKKPTDKMLSKLLQPVRQNHPKISLKKSRRERPRITESSGSLPQGVFTIKHL